ncbi:MAG: hypothetical protein HPY54_12050 [Chthonomonadetes bacterium]|nr:hypothetical protein [Chthonomonadetes bacterium]
MIQIGTVVNARKSLLRFEQVTPDPSWAFDYLKPSQTGYLTHSYHRYPAKFIPQLAQRLITTLSEPGEWVLDPFMGSGTTLVEAKLLGRPSVGVDINPVAYLVSRAKVTPIPPGYLREKVHRLLDAIRTGEEQLSLFSEEPQMPEYYPEPAEENVQDRIRYWFAEPVLTRLWHIHQAIEQEQDEAVLYFFRCAFSNILKPCSYWHNRSVKPTRDLNKQIPDPLVLLQMQLRKMMKGNEQYFNRLQVHHVLDIPAIPYCADARALPVEDGSISLIVTSPPYVTSYEYADLHQLTVLWYRYAQDLREFRPQFIGTAAVNGKEADAQSDLADQIVQQLAQRNRKKAAEVAIYFGEMRQCFTEMYRVLREGGRACIVIGNTAIGKVPILNAQVFVEQMEGMGFVLEDLILREIPSKILPTTRDSKTGKFARVDDADAHAYPHEYILILRKI